MRDTATRDFVRSELRDLLEDLLEELDKRDAHPAEREAASGAAPPRLD
jgi:hypothetical protein